MITPIKLMIIGKMGTGKGVAADYLEQKHDAIRFTRSELMKKVCHALIDGVGSLDELLSRLYPDNLRTQDALRDELLRYAAHYHPENGKPRKLFQEVTDLVIGHDPLVFDVELVSRINSLKPPVEVPFYLLDDVRSLEAYEYFHQQGYKSMRMDAPMEVRRLRMLRRDGYLPSQETFNHPSETALDDVVADYVIDNSANELDPVYRAIDTMMKDLRNDG